MPTVPQVEQPILAKTAKKKIGQKWVNLKNKIFVRSRISKFLCPVQRYDDFKLMMILNLSESLAKSLVMAKLNMAYLKNEKNCCCPHCRCHHLGYSVPPAHHCTIWCQSTFGPRGPGLSNPTSFLRPALPMAPTTDNKARDKQSVLRLNPATFLRDFTLYMTTKDAFI